MLKHLKFYVCDCCGKQISTDEIQMYANRVVGIDGKLMIHISVNSGDSRYPRQETVCLYPPCWAKVFRAVRRALRLEEKAEAGK